VASRASVDVGEWRELSEVVAEFVVPPSSIRRPRQSCSDDRFEFGGGVWPGDAPSLVDPSVLDARATVEFYQGPPWRYLRSRAMESSSVEAIAALRMSVFGWFRLN
jgi:hypothetical protein